MNFRRKEKIAIILVFTLALVMLGAWTWDTFIKSDSDSGTVGKPVELVLEKKSDNGTLVPPSSYYVDEEGYDSVHTYEYTLSADEDLSGEEFGVSFDMSHNDLDEDELFTVFDVKLITEQNTHDLSEGSVDIESLGEYTLEISLNEDLKGSGIGIGRIADRDYEFEIEFFMKDPKQ